MQRNSNKKRSNKVPKEALYPPQITIPLHTGHTYRFIASAAVSDRNLTFQELLDLMCMATAANVAYRFWQAVRIKSIEIWATSPTLDTPVTVKFQYTSAAVGLSGNSMIRSDTSMGYDRPAHIKCKPRDQLLGMWQNAAVNGVYGQISVPKGAVIDITLAASFVETAATPIAVTGAVAGATTGQVYLRALDNTSGVPQLIPVVYPTI